MSSNGRWAQDRGSWAHQRIRRTPMQAPKLSGDGVSLQPSDLEEIFQTKRGLLVSRDDDVVPWLVRVQRGLVLVLGGLMLASRMVALSLREEVLPLLLLLLVVMVMVLVLILESWCGRVLLLVVAVLARMFPLWWQEMLVLVLVSLLTLERVVDFWRTRIHGSGRLVKWGPHEWVLDSGAWIHRTSSPLVVLEGLQFQEIANPRVQLGLGSVRTERFEFPGVHYVSGDDDHDTRNVVSVSQLARDHGLVTVFEPMSCLVKDKKTGEIVGKGCLRNGMYMLDYLHVSGQYIGDGGASGGGERGDGGGGGRGHGGRGNNGEGRGGGGRSKDGSEGGTGASRNQEQGDSGSGIAGGDINDEEIVNEEEEGSSENEIQEMNDENVREDDDEENHEEINGNGEEEDKKRGRSAFGESSNKARTGLLGLSRFALVCLCIAACILLHTSRRTGVICKLPTFIDYLDYHGLLGFTFLFSLGFPPLRTLSMMRSTSRKLVKKQIGSLFRGRSRDEKDKEEGTSEDYVKESSPEHNRRLFGLSRFDVTTDPTGYWRRQLPAGAFPTSTNAARREEFLVDSGASFHATWKESVLFPYPQHLQDHTKPPTRRFGGIVGSIAVTRSGYLNGDKIMLDGVLLALESRMNLVSVGQLSIQYGVQVEMDDEGVTIKKKQDGVRIGGGKMLNNHQYVLEYFQPAGGLFAHRDTPHPKIFGSRRPGPAQ